MRGWRLRATTALVGVAVLITAFASVDGAWAASRVQLREAPISNFPDMAFTLSLPKNQPLSTKQVSVTENGAPAHDVTVERPGAATAGTVLAIDASNSMAGKPIRSAMVAARAFAARRGPGQRLGIVTFNNTTAVLLPPTTDGAAIDKALAAVPSLANGTHIYDALQTAATELKDAGVTNGSIVLLSDGKDLGSTVDQATAIKTVTDARARVFTVGLESGQYDPKTLVTIAAQTKGTASTAANAAELSQIFSELGYTLANEYILRYRSLGAPNEKQRVAVKVDGFAGTARTSYMSPDLPLIAVPSGNTTTADDVIRSPITLAVVIFIVVGLLGYGVYRVAYRPDEELTRRLGQYVSLPEEEQARHRETDLRKAAAAERRNERGDWLERLEYDLNVAGVETSLRTLGLITVLVGLAIGIVVAVLVQSPLGLIAGLVAPLLTRVWINRQLATTRTTFADQLPENLDVVSSGLRSGHSFVGALAVCVDDAEDPSKTELRRVIADEQLGVPVEAALLKAGSRMDNRDIVQVALVARLQREAGTNAAAVIDQVSDNIRARLELRRLIAALTAQGRLARWIVSILPLALFAAIFVLNRGYLRPLWTEPVGIAALVAAVIMVVVGSLVIKRIVDIEV